MKQIVAKKIGQVNHPDIIIQHNGEDFHNPTLEIWKTKKNFYQYHRESGFRRQIKKIAEGVSEPCDNYHWFKEESTFVDEKEITELKEELSKFNIKTE